MRYGCYMDSPAGRLQLAEKDGKLTHVLFCSRRAPKPATDKGTEILAKVNGKTEYFEEKITPVLKETMKELKEYFEGKRKTFDIPLEPEGTEFQKKCWEGLLTVPYGKTNTYKYIAEFAGSPKGFRAAGLANNQNPISIIIPCHRIIGSNSKLVGYGGGLDVKEKLLSLEGVNASGGKAW